MKTMKRIAVLLLTMCLVLPCVSIISHAASGKIQFTDPNTKTGEMVEVTCAIKSDNGGAVGDVKVDIKYDTTMLAFKSGEGIQETAMGNLSYSGKGDSAAHRFVIQFLALKEGTTKLEVTEYEASLATSESLECTTGTSTITIEKGTEVVQTPEVNSVPEGVKVNANGVEYTLSSSFKTEDIPDGFEETTIEYEGANRKFAKQTASGLYLAYLVDADNNGKFFVYDIEVGEFTPFEQIEISANTKIVLLADATEVVMPDDYIEVSITVDDFDFPAWQHMEDTVNYVLYAVNNSGQTSLYQYDGEEGTYQRIEMPEVEEEVVDNSTIAKMKMWVETNFTYALLIAGLVAVFFLVLIIVLGVKLHNRNLELDDLYDEYGIDLDEEVELPVKKEKEDFFEKELVSEVEDKVEVEAFEEDDEEDEGIDLEELASEEDDEEDEGINLEKLEYEEEDDFDLKFQEKIEESFEIEETNNKTMKKDDFLFEDFDLIDLDD